MADHPETTAMRLAEAATEGPWAVDRHRVYVVGPDGRAAGGMSVGMWPTVGRGYREDDAAHIAHAHPGRVKAWLGAVARLRERAAEGHSSRCETQHYSPLQVARGEAAECDCGHEDDLAALGAVDAEG